MYRLMTESVGGGGERVSELSFYSGLTIEMLIGKHGALSREVMYNFAVLP